ncbi:hypothetical protein BDR06DRAFT_101915 [Suillus hirtellus]|nr:hypothetical protein BDR06DRAFT_101915 [Suillus hirtellus]
MMVPRRQEDRKRQKSWLVLVLMEYSIVHSLMASDMLEVSSAVAQTDTARVYPSCLTVVHLQPVSAALGPLVRSWSATIVSSDSSTAVPCCVSSQSRPRMVLSHSYLSGICTQAGQSQVVGLDPLQVSHSRSPLRVSRHPTPCRDYFSSSTCTGIVLRQYVRSNLDMESTRDQAKAESSAGIPTSMTCPGSKQYLLPWIRDQERPSGVSSQNIIAG